MATLAINPVSHIDSNNHVVTSAIFIAAPRERIFAALTDPKQAAQWWGAADRYHMAEFQMDVHLGGKWSTNGNSAKMGAVKVHGEFLEIDPPKSLAYTWISSWMPKTTKVLWELEPKDGGTYVKVTHTGFEGDAEHAKNHSLGWSLVVTWLQAYLERGETVNDRK